MVLQCGARCGRCTPCWRLLRAAASRQLLPTRLLPATLPSCRHAALYCPEEVVQQLVAPLLQRIARELPDAAAAGTAAGREVGCWRRWRRPCHPTWGQCRLLPGAAALAAAQSPLLQPPGSPATRPNPPPYYPSTPQVSRNLEGTLTWQLVLLAGMVQVLPGPQLLQLSAQLQDLVDRLAATDSKVRPVLGGWCRGHVRGSMCWGASQHRLLCRVGAASAVVFAGVDEAGGSSCLWGRVRVQLLGSGPPARPSAPAGCRSPTCPAPAHRAGGAQLVQHAAFGAVLRPAGLPAACRVAALRAPPGQRCAAVPARPLAALPRSPRAGRAPRASSGSGRGLSRPQDPAPHALP